MSKVCGATCAEAWRRRLVVLNREQAAGVAERSVRGCTEILISVMDQSRLSKEAMNVRIDQGAVGAGEGRCCRELPQTVEHFIFLILFAKLFGNRAVHKVERPQRVPVVD